MTALTFNAQQVDTSNSPYDPIPAGWYVCVAKSTDLRETKARDGKYVYVDFEVAPGQPFTGRHLFARITVENPSEQAVQIGHTQLAELCGAIGLMGLTNTDELLGKPVALKTKIRKSEQYGDDNDVVGFKAASKLSGAQDAQPAGVAAATAQAPATAERPPWAA